MLGSRGSLDAMTLACPYQIGYAHTKLFDADVSRKFTGPLTWRNLSKATDAFEKAAAIDVGHPQASAALDRVRQQRHNQRARTIFDTWVPLVLGALCLAVFVLIQLVFFLGPLRGSLSDGFENKLTPTSYATLVFGILVVTVAVVSLPQLLKLRFGAVSLEKAPLEQIAPVELGIRSAPLGGQDMVPRPMQLDTDTAGPRADGRPPPDGDGPGPSGQAKAGAEAGKDGEQGPTAADSVRALQEDGSVSAGNGNRPPPETEPA